MADEETKETPKIGTYEYAISKGATEEQALDYAARMSAGSDDEEDESAESEPGSSAPKYFIHSTVRARHTRLKRMKAPVHAALLQHIGGLRIRRKRPVPVTEEKLGEIIHQLRAAHAEGRLELRTADGRIVDLFTGEPQGLAPTPRPVAGAPLDTAATDKPAGIPLPVYQEGAPLGVPGKRPAVIPNDDEGDEDDDWNENTKSIPPMPSTPPPAAATSEAEVQTNPSGLPPPPAVPQISAPEGESAEPEAPAVQPGEGQGEGGAAETTPEQVLAQVDEQIAEGGTNEAPGDTEEADDETTEASDETEPEEEQPPVSTPGKVPLPQVARRGGGKKRGNR